MVAGYVTVGGLVGDLIIVLFSILFWELGKLMLDMRYKK